ncbi:MAG: hypothetical protein H0T75_17160, partial [Rhizobiales bacterium]|nr:hypothetical protein [Hyphomicrobiales bacterium]
AYKWLGRWRASGAAALYDRKPTPARSPHACRPNVSPRSNGCGASA